MMSIEAYQRKLERNRRWRASHKEKLRKWHTAYNKTAHAKALALERQRRYSATEHGRLKRLEWVKKYQQTEKGKVNSKKQQEKRKLNPQWYIKKRELDIIYRVTSAGKLARRRAQNRYRKTLKGRIQTARQSHSRKAALLGCGSVLTIERIQQVYEANIKRYGTLTCCLCFEPIEFGKDSLEHAIPLARREEFPGVDLNAIENLGIAHRSCNTSKGKQTLEEWFNRYPSLALRERSLIC